MKYVAISVLMICSAWLYISQLSTNAGWFAAFAVLIWMFGSNSKGSAGK